MPVDVIDIDKLLGEPPTEFFDDDDWGDDRETNKIVIAWWKYDVLGVYHQRLPTLTGEFPLVKVIDKYNNRRDFCVSGYDLDDAGWMPVQSATHDVVRRLGFEPLLAWPVGEGWGGPEARDKDPELR